MGHRIIVQVSDADKVSNAIVSCRNLIDDMPDAEIEVVFHQSAIEATMRGTPVEPDVMDLMRRGIKVVACRNSMRARNINEEKLINGVSIVKAGVGEIVRRQAEGWIYLRL
ncbi:MAG: DsrE family protein [Thermocladium sp.]